MRKDPLVSIITPSLNQGRYLRQTIDSIFSQDYPNIEYIVMDGGSTDNTLGILRSAGKPQFYWESRADTGQADAINRGLRRAKGEIVGYLNSDDYYMPHAISTVVEYFQSRKDVRWVTGDCRIVNDKGKEIHRAVRWYKKALRGLHIPLLFANSLAQPSTFWRRSLLQRVGYFDDTLRYTFDFEYWLRLSRVISPKIMGECISAFRIHNRSKGGSMYRRQFEEEEKVLSRYTDSPIMLKLHRIHTRCILATYDWIK